MPHDPTVQIHNDRLAAFADLRTTCRQIGLTLRAGLVITLLMLALLALRAGHAYTLYVCVWLFAMDIGTRYVFRRIDECIVLLMADDLPLTEHEQECFDALCTRHPIIAERLFPTDTIRRGHDLRVFSRSIPE